MSAKEDVPVTLRVEIPTLPNFLRVRLPRLGHPVNAPTIPIADLTDAELRAVAEAWTENLLEKARKDRVQP